MNENQSGGNAVIAIGSDHAGYPLKEALIEELTTLGYQFKDFGTFSLESVDYPDIGREVAEAVAAGKFERAILICGTGIGISITANKVKGIRAAVCSESFSARMSRAHNDANVLAMGARVVGTGLAVEIAKAFLETEFEAGRHKRRVDKIEALDNSEEGTCGCK
ncbi:MAG: ribose 5-phosphate isomerase B [Chloroflexi bacterium]|nr:ribose 5-phosphate isomerase B [Chloroflexota bacterium]MCL5104056.1 ribose 5-phosphate isomerase B [Armatimonadota bacterium]